MSLVLVEKSGGVAAVTLNQIGWVNAMEIILAATSIEAERALSIGPINRVVASEDVLTVAREFCDRIAEGAPLALAKAKEAVLRSSGRDLAQAFQIEQACQAVIMASEDAREGPRAFMERRAPRFVGR
jgi:enoyl-CoA hydratase